MAENELLEKLELWLATLPAPPNIFEVIRTGDGELFAAFVLKGFRAAARGAVLERLKDEAAAINTGNGPLVAGSVLRVFDGITAAWSLTESERLALLGLNIEGLRAAQAMPDAELPIEIIERVAILMDTFQSINTLLPDARHADTWLRTSNKAPAFGGASALSIMLSSLEGMRKVRAYLLGQLYGG